MYRSRGLIIQSAKTCNRLSAHSYSEKVKKSFGGCRVEPISIGLKGYVASGILAYR